MLAK
jgi:hypothetical protein